MRTSKPIATISYNSQEFLVSKLDELIRNHKISDYMFINHFAEEDERKNHIHLWINPNTLIDSMDLQNFFKEYDIANPLKPLGCIDFKSSKVDDWILYNSHYEPYLASKGESRLYHYTRDDFVYHDEYTFEDRWNHAFKGSDWAKRNQILMAIKEGSKSPTELIMNGTVPLNMASQLSAFKYMQTHYGTDRNGRPNHEDQDEDITVFYVVDTKNVLSIFYSGRTREDCIDWCKDNYDDYSKKGIEVRIVTSEQFQKEYDNKNSDI